MPGCCRPGFRQIVERIPMNPRCSSDKQFSRSTQTKLLHFFRTEGGDADLRHPNRQVGNGTDFIETARPFLNHPIVPIEWKTMHGHGIELVEDAEVLDTADEMRINRRNAAENARKI